MRSLNRKLLRDVWHLRGQVLAIALVMASGIGLLVMGLTALEALQETARAYYERHRFAQVFAHVERAPLQVAARIAALPGVQTVETRIVRNAVVDISGFNEPVTAQLVSIPTSAPQRLNLLALRAGRLPDAAGEAVLSEPFATAHHLQLGATVRATLNNKWRQLRVVGIALSPEYVYAIGPGTLMPDDLRFGVMWLGEREMQAAFDLTDAFNDVSLTLLRGVDPGAVIERLDALLAPYGSIGGYARADQLSNWFLMNEIEQLKTMSRTLPVIFLLVAAFLTNMVLARLIAVERAEIGLLKAFGYSDREVFWHYCKFVALLSALGVLLGWIAGYFLGWYETRIYAEFYHFPFLLFHPSVAPFLLAAGAGFGAALIGALRSVRIAATLPPAQAMQAPMPPAFHRTRLGRSRYWAKLEHATRIVLRQIARWPMRSLTTCLGIAMSVAVLVISLQWLDAIDQMVNLTFREAQTQDLTVSFATPRSAQAATELGRLPGVLAVEPMRMVSAKLKSRWRQEREALQGLPMTQQLYRVYDAAGRPVTLPEDGLVISTMLADLLQVKPGDHISVEILEGRRGEYQLPIAATFETYIGSPAYLNIDALARLLQQRRTASSVHLRVDANRMQTLLQTIKQMPGISGITIKAAAIRTFDETMAQTILIFVSFFIVFSCALSIGVTYNAARIALSERGRELATLRVLGFTRMEISYLLLAEIALLTLLALPLGCVIGRQLAQLIIQTMETELFRIPLVIDPSTYGWSITVVLLATTLSALVVRTRIDRLDLIAVLKTRE